MSIVLSTHIEGFLQVDGRRYVTEFHTDDVGVVHSVEYLAAVNADYVAIRDARVAQINEQLAEAEAQALIADGA